MLTIAFWTVVISKNLFWAILPDNLRLATMLWFAMIGSLAVAKMVSRGVSPVFRVPRDLFLFGAYLIICAVLSVVSPSGFEASNVVYALVPLCVLPFVGSANAERQLRQAGIGIVIGASMTIAFAASQVGLLSFSSRVDVVDGIGPNTVALLCAMASFFLIYLYRTEAQRWRVVWGGLVPIFITVMVLTLGKTVIVSFLFALVVSNISRRPGAATGPVVMVLAVLLLAMPFVSDYVLPNLLQYLEGRHSFDTLTGRTFLWEELLSRFDLLNVLAGFGFNSSRFLSQDAGYMQFGVEAFTHAHNAVIESMINTGIFGTIILFGLFLQLLIRRAVSSVRALPFSPVLSLEVALLVLICLRSISEPTIAQPASVELFIFALVLLRRPLAVGSGSSPSKVHGVRGRMIREGHWVR